jgi:biotin carboxyl carrier protein
MIRETDRIFPGPVSSFQDESGETGYFFRSGDKVYLHRNGKTFVGRWEERELGSGSQVALEIRSPMPGKIIQINRGVGDEFQPGEVLAVLEAMKMENQLKAAFHGRIRSLRKTLGDLVSQDEIIIELEPIEADS